MSFFYFFSHSRFLSLLGPFTAAPPACFRLFFRLFFPCSLLFVIPLPSLSQVKRFAPCSALIDRWDVWAGYTAALLGSNCSHSLSLPPPLVLFSSLAPSPLPHPPPCRAFFPPYLIMLFFIHLLHLCCCFWCKLVRVHTVGVINLHNVHGECGGLLPNEDDKKKRGQKKHRRIVDDALFSKTSWEGVKTCSEDIIITSERSWWSTESGLSWVPWCFSRQKKDAPSDILKLPSALVSASWCFLFPPSAGCKWDGGEKIPDPSGL